MFGAICGDILGSRYEYEERKYTNPSDISLMCDGDRFTDDTILTLAVADWVMHDVRSSRDDGECKRALAKKMADYVEDRYQGYDGGYGKRFLRWCQRARLLGDYAPMGSSSSGAGMRVSPIGWCFDTLEQTLHYAKMSADVTHDHPAGQKGAMCIAAAIFLARTGTDKEEIRRLLHALFGYDELLKDVATLREACVRSDSCQSTVPLSVVAFLESTDYESAVRLAISYGGDSDTISAMAGSIAEAYYGGVPESLLSFCTARLDDYGRSVCDEFRRTARCPA